MALLTLTLLGGCGSEESEKAVHLAKPGDLLVRTDSGEEVRLVKSFRAGVPNGLYEGVVDVISKTNGSTSKERLNTNAVCSIEGLPGWPDYDNVYGSRNQDNSTSSSSDNRWQILLHFDGRIEEKTTQHLKASPAQWAPRLRDNLCRKGDFDDRPIAGN